MFEIITVNYRPVLIDGVLEKSYPSSTTLLVVCVMSTAVMQFNFRIYDKMLRKAVSFIIGLFIVFMVLYYVLVVLLYFIILALGASAPETIAY
jgi:undecaprenyl-diphosphatase